MRKVLLGTTALVAAAALAGVGAAQADDEMMEGPVTVGVGGYTTGALGIASDSSGAQRAQEITYVYEVGVSGSTTLDNGITVSVSGQIGASSGGNADEFDEIHTTLSGSFGSLRLGRTESAAFNSTVPAPGAGIGGMLGVNYGWFSTAAKAVNTYSGLGAEDALKVVYTSPNFNGLTIGMSYAPESSEANAPGRTTAGLGELTAVGINYSTDFMEGGSLSFGMGYEVASASAGMDPEAMRFGVNVSVDELSFGGSMLDDENTATSGAAFDVGASWTEGPMEIGIQYAADENQTVGAGTPATHTHVAGAVVPVAAVPGPTGETTKTALHLTYTLGPGILVGGQIAAGTIEGMDDVTQFMIGTTVFF